MQVQLDCPNCTTAIRYDDINIEKMVAKCSKCNSVFSFDKQITLPGRQKTEILLPDGVDALHLFSELDIRISWRKSLSGFFLFFTIFWNAIVLPMALFALASGAYEMLIFMSIHIFIGVSFLYYLIATLVNTTYIIVDDYNLTIEHRPLKVPFYPRRDIPASEIDQIFTDKYVAGKTNGRPNYAFAIQALLKNNEKVKLLKSLKHPDQALYVEQEIEKFLKIKDRPVENEYKGS